MNILNTTTATIELNYITEAGNSQAAAITSGFFKDLIGAKVPQAVYPKKIHRSREEVEVMNNVKDKEQKEIQEGDVRVFEE